MAGTHVEQLTRGISLSSGLRMRYYEWPGSGPCLIFLHPSSGYGRMWDMTANTLAGQFHIFAPDQRGHGDTDKPDGGYAAEDYAEDLHLFVEELGLGRAIVAGHSLGGRVAQVFAATHSEQCQAIILVGGPHYPNFFQERDRVNEVLEGAERMRVSQTEFPSAEAALDSLRQARSTDSEETMRHRVEHNTRSLPGGGVAFKYDKVRVAHGLTHIADDLRTYAKRATCAVGILRGSRDIHLSMEEAERIAHFWKDARISEVDAAYNLEMENPGGLAQAILDFTRASVSV